MRSIANTAANSAAALIAAVGVGLMMALPAAAQSFRVQCPTSTITHPDPSNSGLNNTEPPYVGPTKFGTSASGNYQVPTPATVNGAIKCQQISGGDGYATMADGTQTFMFSFGPLSGLANMAAGNPNGLVGAGAGTEYPFVFNTVYPGTLLPGDPATTNGASDAGTAGSYSAGTLGNFTYNGAVGTMPDLDCIAGNANATAAGTALPCPNLPSNGIDGHVDPRQIMDVGTMNGNIPAPLMAFDEDDEFFLTLSNVGMIMRPDLFEQHTVHFHGYPNASSFYDGVPDASVAINIGGSFTYYYLAPDAGTYFWHCHITPPEHLQMGMVGQLYVRPRQDRVPTGNSILASLALQENDLRTACRRAGDTTTSSAITAPVLAAPNDILCSNPLPATANAVTQTVDVLGNPQKYAYNDGDGSTGYDVEYPLQIHGFDPNFHFVGQTFNPEAFVDMKDKYFLLNGRSYPDTATNGPMATQSSDGRMHYSQPMAAVINIPVGGKALLRIADLDVTEYQTLASLGIPMHVIGYNAKLLRDQGGANTDYYANSITLGGGESLDVILDASNKTQYPSGSVFYLYTPQLDHLSNDAENFGGLMTEVHIN
jgi:FtsP/CotA-like multicopper oxidase with cupredoxin domain